MIKKIIVSIALLTVSASGYSYTFISNPSFALGLEDWPNLSNYEEVEYTEEDLGNTIVDHYLKISPRTLPNGNGYAVLLNQNIPAISGESLHFYAKIGFSSSCDEIKVDAKINSIQGTLTRKEMILRGSDKWHVIESDYPARSVGSPVLQFDFYTTGCLADIHVDLVQVGSDKAELKLIGRGMRNR